MGDYLIKSGKLILPDTIYEDGDVLVRGGKIVDVGRGIEGEGAEEIDAGGKLIAPGLIDIHIHGAVGVMSESPTKEGLKDVSVALAKMGTLAFIPTIGAMPEDMTIKALSIISDTMGAEEGAEILGIHMEGPYLNTNRAGAQMQGAIRNYKGGDLKKYIEASSGNIRIMSLAPEIEGGTALIEELVENGIVPGAVHTDATFQEATDAINRGLRLTCHTFNAMRPIHHREPGICTAALIFDTLFSEFIADGFHLSFPILEMAYRMKGPDKMVLVSDAVGALGIPPGDYDFFGVSCRVGGGKVTISGTDHLAGSASPLLFGVKNLYEKTSINLPHIFRVASLNPATVIGIDDRLGSITVGKDANLLILDDKLDIIRVWIGEKNIRLKG